MKYIMFFKNKFNLSIAILSLLSIIPFVFFFINAKELNDLQDITNANDAHINATLSKTIDQPGLLIPFVIGMFIWITITILSGFAISRNKVKTVYGMTSFLIGGLGLHLIVALFYLIPFKKISFNIKKTSIYIGGGTIAAGLAAAPIAGALAMSSFEKPVQEKDIKMSLDLNSPNLVEIFTDGFDLHFDNDLFLKNDTFKDFNNFTHFMTPGHPTHLSMPMIFDDFKTSNPFYRMHQEKLLPEEYQQYAYGKELLETGVKHMQVAKDKFSSRTIINPVGMSNNPSYGASVSGTPDGIIKLDKDINVTNWTGARQGNSGDWGISKLSPDSGSYQWMNEHMKLGTGNKGARVYISDMITHRPFLNDANGDLQLFDTSREHAVQALYNNINSVIERLKSIKQGNVSAYDNTMIVIYGDHSSHDFIPVGSELNVAIRKQESALMIKYPTHSQATHSTLNNINDRYVWGPQINGIIENYFNNVSNINALDYFKDQKFDNIERPVFIKSNEYVGAKWFNDSIVLSSPEVIYNQSNYASQIDQLNKVVY